MLFVLAFAALWASWRSLRRAAGDPPPAARGASFSVAASGSAAGIVLVAAILRLLALPLAPALSNDVLRYVWDGRVAAAGENPYLLAPDDERLRGLRAPPKGSDWGAIDHRDVATVYPPLALGLFTLTSQVPAPVVALKAALALADLAGVVWLLGLAAAVGVPRYRVVAYAWNPLVVIETAGMGHVDALGVAAAIGAALLVVRARQAGSPDGAALPEAGRRTWLAAGAGVAAALGVLAKLVPVVALPLWARQSRRPWLLAAAAAAVLLAALAPIAWTAGGAPPGLLAYGKSWEFNGPLFEPLWRLLAAADAELHVKGWLERLKEWTESHDFWNPFYPLVYPQLLAKGLLASALAAAVALGLGDRRPIAGPGRLFGAAILASATVYPWYVLWVLPWAALAAQPAWLALSATVVLAYLPRLVGVELFPWVWLAVWGPPAVGLLLFRSWRRWTSA